ncbi:hypothetical protein TVAG_400000 [Trichomonas vaginalis G3]|uniref:Uncharacterized protein n=1 Tax=Trichomonas vaginalis (strain ATCC PRA-98 / G3) TaxID=412133 RepID=A2G6C9_TRIV3|nr:hypothetical protein TVAGG3_0398780 [Trichomonas vaginalis G3]EAX87289.1 hypothetical protein TVAG_400000 [Trichomonas vaginalis G3]KAI5534533.1 hypothetical protein TVAGG3_0398780 [Trichomonas vaginalis G3]|eukprot:XP_001300219.1 hypothetical protein [Trichomonas vaginalis G3]
MVLQNHPWITSVNAQDFGLDGQPKFFTNNLTVLKMSLDGEPGINWLAFSWLNNYIKEGESMTFSYLYYDKEYEPPILNLDKSLISEEVDSTEPIHLKGSFSHYGETLVAKAYYAIYEADSYKVVKSGSLGSFTVSKTKMSQDFDVFVEPPTQLGKYELEVYTYLPFFKSYLSEYFYITVVPPNYRPKLFVLPPEYVYYIPDSEVSFLATVYDQDSGDKPLTAEVFFNNAEVVSQEVANNRDLKTFKFKIPKDTKADDYEVKVTATDGKKIGTKKFTITIKNNTVLTIDFEPKLNATYNKGDKVNFTAVINDPDTNFDTKFTVSLFYNTAMKTSLTSENKNGLVRIPLTFSIPSDEINTTAEIKIEVKTPTESSDRSTSITIHQDTTANLAKSKTATKESQKKNALIAVLCVLAVLAVIVAIVIVILWLRK